MKYTKVNPDAYKEIQFNACVLCTDFDVETGELDETDIFATTSGGISLEVVPTFTDLGENIDNVKSNTKELKRLSDWSVHASGTHATINESLAQRLLVASDISDGKITLRDFLKDEDFKDIWIVGDYGEEGNFIAVKLYNVINNEGLKMTTTNKDKGTFAFDYIAHSSLTGGEIFEMYFGKGV